MIFCSASRDRPPRNGLASQACSASGQGAQASVVLSGIRCSLQDRWQTHPSCTGIITLASEQHAGEANSILESSPNRARLDGPPRPAVRIDQLLASQLECVLLSEGPHRLQTLQILRRRQSEPIATPMCCSRFSLPFSAAELTVRLSLSRGPVGTSMLRLGLGQSLSTNTNGGELQGGSS